MGLHMNVDLMGVLSVLDGIVPMLLPSLCALVVVLACAVVGVAVVEARPDLTRRTWRPARSVDLRPLGVVGVDPNRSLAPEIERLSPLPSRAPPFAMFDCIRRFQINQCARSRSGVVAARGTGVLR